MRVFRVATFVACIGTAAAQGALLSLLSRFQVPTGTPQPSSSSSSFSSEPTPGSGGFFISAFTEDVAPPLDINDFETPKFAVPLSIAEAVAGVNASVTTISSNAIKAAKALLPSLLFPDWAGKIPNRYRSVIEPFKFHKRQTQCSNPRIRTEWDSYSASDRQAFIDALRCLMRSPPKNNIGGARNRYEDLVALHQTLTPTVHGNAKFLLWHRYYLWTVEDVLRKECGFNRNFPWFDETKYAGSFGRSSIFSSQYFGTFAARGDCVRTGQFANITINVGPGSRNVRHCLSRNGNEQKTQNCNAAIVRACNNRGTYADMASCAEGAAHAWGHNGIGAVMQDTYAAPADPVFWLHHAFIDRNFAQWQNANVRTRTTTVGGTDENGRRLTVDTTIAVGNVRPSVRIGDLLNTLNSGICYRYDA